MTKQVDNVLKLLDRWIESVQLKWSVRKHKEDSEITCYVCQEPDSYELTRLKCKHYIHKECLQTQIAKCRNLENGEIIDLFLSQCGVCKQFIRSRFLEPNETEWIVKLAKHHAYYERLRLSPRPDRDPDKFFYYKCYTCGKLTAGAYTNCLDNVEFDENFLTNKRNNLCFRCKFSCPDHADKFLVYKCRYCCDLATFNCTNVGYLCKRCHNEIPPRTLKPCSCQISHEPNGSLFPALLGCAGGGENCIL